MIVSASRRTDIPAFFSDWFLDRLRAGSVTVTNPFNSNSKRRVSLRKEDVDGFVFWTRNPAPFGPSLDAVDALGIPYYFLITINQYPAELEPVHPNNTTVKKFLADLASRIGTARIIWRYDPLVVSALTPIAYHKEHFKALADMISPYCDKVIVSLMDNYRKVVRRFKKIGLVPEDIRGSKDVMEDLFRSLAQTAGASGLTMQACAEELVGLETLIPPGRCIDNELLNSHFGLQIAYEKDKNQRKGCLCTRSVDIGSYGTCRFRCLYCYAR